MLSDACACSEPMASRVSPSSGEGEPERGFALEDERDAARRLDELGGVDDRVVVDRLGEEPAHGREVALDQQRGDGLLVGREGDQLAVVACW